MKEAGLQIHFGSLKKMKRRTGKESGAPFF
jgi:hypothetical protein